MSETLGAIAVPESSTRSEREIQLERELGSMRRELRRKERELLAKDEELRSLFYTVSHELKTPLISLRGFSSLLQEFYGTSLPEEAHDYLERIQRNVDQMEHLINNLLVVSRIQIAEKDFEEIEVREVVDEAIWELQFTLRETGGKVTLPSELPVVRCNRNLLLTVFVNLIGNALKYAKPNVAPLVEIGYSGDEIFHKFWVKDNGVGIPPRGRERLFSMFSRLGNKRGVDGSGLGLAIVKRIVEGHGGEVWVRSRVGVGSCFYFTLAKTSPRG